MFLGTTALSDFWARDQRILFLGRWCLREDRRPEWEGLTYEVMPSPWNDREAFHEAAEYLDRFAERLLPALAEYLGAVHGEKRSPRFWRILLGPWLTIAAHTTFDRFVCLQSAERRGEFQTRGLHRDAYEVPSSTLDHFHSILDDRSNLQLFTQLLESMGHDMIRVRPSESATRSKLRDRARARRYIRKTITRATRSVLAPLCRIALVNMSATLADEWRLTVSSRFRALPVSFGIETQDVPARFDGRRLGLSSLPAESQFERCFVQLLPTLVPTGFLEGFDSLREAKQQSLRRLQGVVSAVGWHADDATKYALADLADRGKKVFAVQHGAGYGQFRSAPAELHEKRIADRYLVWGWADQSPEKLRNVPDIRLSRIAERRRKSKEPTLSLLFVATNHPRYLYRFHSCPVGSQWEEYFQWQCRFFTAIGSKLCDVSIYKPYPVDYGTGLAGRIFASFPGIGRHNGALHSISNARLVVVDHCGTTMLESLAADVPTVLFWDPARWELRPTAADDFQALRSAGILHMTPESAASHIQSVYEDPMTWWRSERVRLALDRFVHRQALSSQRWPSEWVRTLSHELRRTGT